MLKHIVFFNLAEFAEGKSKQENALFIKSTLEGLKPLIPQLVSLEVGINHSETPETNFDIALVCEFQTLVDLDSYQNHPEHQRVAAYIAKVRTERACVDYIC